MAEHGHGHESADKHHSKGGEWIGPKTKEALGAAGGNMIVAKALFATACIFPPLWMYGAIGFMGAGSYAFGARNRAGGGHKGRGAHKGGGH